MFVCYFVAKDRQGLPTLEELAGNYESAPEAVYAFMEVVQDAASCEAMAFVVDDAGVIVATVTEVGRDFHHGNGGEAPSRGFNGVWTQVVVVGSAYPDGERWLCHWANGEFEKRRVSVSVAGSA